MKTLKCYTQIWQLTSNPCIKKYIYYQYQKKEKNFLDFQIFFHQDFHAIHEK